MKRAGYLYEQIASIENVKKAYYKAKKGKTFARAVLLFRMNEGRNLEKILMGIRHEEYRIGMYHYFKIYDPKERTICAAPFEERILHHAVMNILESYFEKYQIFDSYACRKGKGTLKALKRALYYTKRSNYFLKLDVRKYFDSIDHAVLKELLRRQFKDAKLLRLLNAIVDSYNTIPGNGIPIGNLTSQFFANHYLGVCDHYIKEELKGCFYVRYMDDMVLWSPEKKELKDLLSGIDEFVREKLRLDLKQPYINAVSQGLPFLGFLIKPEGIFLSEKKILRAKRKLSQFSRHFQDGLWSEEELADHVLPVVSHLMIARSRNLRRNLFDRLETSSGSNRVKRGGSWNNNASNCRTANRNNNNPENRNNNLGFRLARPAAQHETRMPHAEPDVLCLCSGNT